MQFVVFFFMIWLPSFRSRLRARASPACTAQKTAQTKRKLVSTLWWVVWQWSKTVQRMTTARNCSVTLEKNELQLWDGMERMMLYFVFGGSQTAPLTWMLVVPPLSCHVVEDELPGFTAVQSVSPWLALVQEASRQLCSIHVMIFNNFVLHLWWCFGNFRLT